MRHLNSIIKQLGPIPEYPPDPNRERPFVLQAHARGRSIHLDLRFLISDFAEGWTISAVFPDAVPWPVLTLSQLQELVEMPQVWKIDFETGLIRPREVKTTIKGKERIIIRPGNLFAERKAQIIPPEWLRVQGRTELPPDWPKTILESWDELPEYARKELRKEGFDPEWAEAVLKEGTWDVTEIPVGATRSYPGVFLVIDEGTYTLGARKVWFYEYFIEKAKILPERIAFRLVTRAQTLKKALWFEKLGALVLPPGVEEEEPRMPGYWIFMTPDPMPYVVSDEAINEKWLPPKGVAALPQKIQKEAPSEGRFWEKETPAEREEARLRLREWLEGKEGETKVEKQMKTRFKLLKQTYKGQVVIRFGPSTTLFWFLLEEPRLVLVLDNDPRIRRAVAGWEMDPKYFDLLIDLQDTDVEPGTELNPTKDTPSRITVEDSGEAVVMEQQPGFLRLRLDGSELKGYYICSWEDEDSPIVLFSQAQDIVAKAEEPKREWRLVAKQAKKQIVYGVVLSPHGPDGHGHVIPEDVIETAAHRYMIFGRKIGLFHHGDPIEAYPVESFIARTDFYMEEGNEQSLVRKGEWVLGVWIVSPEVWKLFERGEVTGFSIQGLAEIEPVP